MVTGAAERLAKELKATGRVRIPLDVILTAWSAASPELIGSSHQHQDLAVVLDELTTAGQLVLPGERSWDRTTRPPLPTFVTWPANRRAPRGTPWRTYPWRTELGWAGSLPTMHAASFEALVAVNRWLGTPASDVVPMRVRSVEIFGDEKALDRLTTTGLFAEGRLSLDLLRCRRYPPPLTITDVGAGPDLLVVENADPYWVAVETARAAAGPVGKVAWGAGRGILQSVHAVTELPQPPQRIWYWGDMDPEGISIAASVATLVTDLGLPPLRPASALWAEMAACAIQEQGSVRWERTSSGERWLGAALWDALAPVRDARGRVAQEAVPACAVLTWLRALG